MSPRMPAANRKRPEYPNLSLASAEDVPYEDVPCFAAYFFSRWPPKVERVDHPKPPVSETERKPATLRLVTALLGLGL